MHVGNLIEFSKRLHEKRVAESEREALELMAAAKAGEAESKRPPPPHPWVLMLDLVRELRPDMTQAEAAEYLADFLGNADPRCREAWAFFLDYGFELPVPA